MNVFSLWVIFALLDPDPDADSGSGSTDLIESGSGYGSGSAALIPTFSFLAVYKALMYRVRTIN